MVPIFRQGFTCLALLVIICVPFRVREYHPLRSHFPERSTKHTQLNGLFPVRSPLLRESQLISFPKGTEMFHFPSFAFNTMYSCCNTYLMVSGFPHSESPDHRICRLPELFAGYTSFFASDCQGIHHMHLIT